MRVPNREHESCPWRVREIAPDFELLDVWALPAHGGADDFGTLLDVVATLDPAHIESRATRVLFRARHHLGRWFGWDDDGGELPVPGATETTLRDRLPDDLRGTATGLDLGPSEFSPLYRTDAECAAEISNRTVHGLVHLAWAHQGDGRYQGRMAVYVRPRGALGRGYLALIAPFRHLVVYPALLRAIGRAWETRAAQGPARNQRPARNLR